MNNTTHTDITEPLDENEQMRVRKEKLQEIRAGGNAFPNDFHRNALAKDCHEQYDVLDNEALQAKAIEVAVGGRIITRRVMGKASFITLQDMSGRVQLYVTRDDLGEDFYENHFKKWDLGDVIGAEGTLFKTKTGELSIRVKKIILLTKSLRPLPDKWHGLSDIEVRYRQRYIDLIINEHARNVFQMRSNIVTAVRQFFNQHNFMEVETPMLQTLAGGAAAKPFSTYHNALDMEMFLRIAPELYLKRLIVGGFEKVFEINRNFRNEGVSTRHNPEFTMLECYEAYANVEDGLRLTENLLRFTAQQVLGTTKVEYQERQYDLGKPFHRLTVLDAIVQHNPEISRSDLQDIDKAKAIAKQRHIHLEPSYGLGKIQMEIFDATTEASLMEPTFITEYPAEVSPLARRNDNNPFITDRFELYIAGRELANGFSELNDAELQAEVFHEQAAAKQAGDEEAMHYDEDFITALEYGLPPTSGMGMGIDRLVMFLTNAPSIRDVILFPHMRRVEQ